MLDKKQGRPVVYICSRYSGDTDGNLERARKYCRYATDRGVVPLAPHLMFPQFIKEDSERWLAMVMDLELLHRCDEVWVFGIENGVSDGMAEEIRNAGCDGQEIRYFTDGCKELYA